MATISASGIGSGLDINGIVTQLVAAERAPTDSRLSQSTARIQAQISALGALSGAAGGFESALTALSNGTAFGGRSAKASSTNFTATAESNAAAGNYSVRIESLASSQRLASAAVPSAADAFGSGELTLTLNGASYVVDFPAIASMDEIMEAINTGGDNPGITASILKGVDGDRLVLSSSESGSASAITVSASGGDGGLDALVYQPGVTENLTETSPANDAEVFIDGFRVTSTGNTVTGALQGVTLNLEKAEPGVTHQLTVASNPETSISAIEKFVGSYNALVATISTVTRFDPGTGQAASLVGDPAARALGNRLRALMGDEHGNGNGNGPSTLSQLGISTATDGTLKLDKAVLTEALADDPQGVKALFDGGSGEGLADKLAAVVSSYVGSDGILTGRKEGAQKRLEDISDQREVLNRRMESLEARYRSQFIALDTLMSQLQSTSNYLTQQLANLPGSYKPK